MIKGSHHTEEIKKKISESIAGEKHPNYGIHFSEETKRKISESNIGKIAWNKGLTKGTDERVKMFSEKLKGKKVSEETRLKMRSRVHTEETKRKISEANKGSHCTEEHKRKIGEAKIGNKNPMYNVHLIPWNKGLTMDTDDRVRKYGEANKGEKCHFWKGGITPLHQSIRDSYKTKEWRLMVFGRDNFTCQDCGKRGCYLEAHHIKKFSSIMQYHEITTKEESFNCEALWDINNGITLCKECHKKLRGDNNGSD